MSYESAFKEVTDWLWKEYPTYNGWRMRSFAWEYDISDLPSEVFHGLADKFESFGEIELADVQRHIERVHPPEGFVFVTLQKDNVRVGFNVPAHVFQEQP